VRILLLDNYDSFTYNLRDYLLQLNSEVLIRLNDQIKSDEVASLKLDAIVFSPGPRRPKEAGVMMQIINDYHQSIPMLGICLGHQAIGEYFGASLVHAAKPMHGKVSEIFYQENSLFNNISNPFTAMRYHSLVLENLPDCLNILAQTKEMELMVMQHKNLPIIGIQFHPESILTKDGLTLLRNWISLIK
jgi:anthranilate synthase component 2